MDFRRTLIDEAFERNLGHSMKGVLETNEEYERFRGMQS